jgi:hypothetical protein
VVEPANGAATLAAGELHAAESERDKLAAAGASHHREPHERAPLGIRGPRLVDDPCRVGRAWRVRLRLRRPWLGNHVQRVDSYPSPPDSRLESAVEHDVNMPERGATKWLADVLLASPVAMEIGIRIRQTALPVLDKGLPITAPPAATKLRVELLDQGGAGLREPGQLHTAERRNDERLRQKAVVVNRFLLARMLIQPLREKVSQRAARAGGPVLRDLASQPVPEADGVSLRLHTAREVDVLPGKRIDAAEDADLV